MATHLVRRMGCFFRGHHWKVEHNRTTQGTEEDCLRCGVHRSTFPGATEANLSKQRPGHIPDDGAIGGGWG
jgi:hypothetical protein